MIDKLKSSQQWQFEKFLSKSAILFVRVFGSWASVVIHTLIFGGWFLFKLNIDTLLVIISIEAIYIGIFILMAENIETAQKERLRKIEHRKDMAVVKQDVAVDQKSLQEVKKVHQKIDQIQELIKKK